MRTRRLADGINVLSGVLSLAAIPARMAGRDGLSWALTALAFAALAVGIALGMRASPAGASGA